jgi:peptidoglycan/LPS O-acetylase OafA/YrhL
LNSSSITKTKGYYKYLDTWRFIAVTVVIFSHWLPSYSIGIDAGIGVNIFFALSGFLITENLLKQKTKIVGVKDLGSAFKTFYIRRSLRIFPIYYLVIILLLIVPVAILADHVLWYLFYAVNVMISRQQEWPGMFSHLWSLAVEEQFYLFWPAIIFFFPLKWLDKVIMVLIGASLLFNEVYGSKDQYASLQLPACIYTLCSGALLAYYKNSDFWPYRIIKYDWWVLLFFSIGLFLSIHAGFGIYWTGLYFAGLLYMSVKILITRKNKWFDLFFANRYICFLGKISYGLYLYHNFIPWFLRNLNGTEDRYVVKGIALFPPLYGGWPLLIQHWILLLLFSVFSWFVIEKPFNSLKSRFTY